MSAHAVIPSRRIACTVSRKPLAKTSTVFGCIKARQQSSMPHLDRSRPGDLRSAVLAGSRTGGLLCTVLDLELPPPTSTMPDLRRKETKFEMRKVGKVLAMADRDGEGGTRTWLRDARRRAGDPRSWPAIGAVRGRPCGGEEGEPAGEEMEWEEWEARVFSEHQVFYIWTVKS